MEAFKTIIWIINIFSSLTIIALVLMQHGKGADTGASFGGSGSAQGVFGSGGNANFLSRMTGLAATVFFASCLALGYVNSKASGKVSDFSDVQQSQVSGSVKQVPVPVDVLPVEAASSGHLVAASAASVVSSTTNDGNALETAAVAGTAVAAGKMALDKVQDKTKSDKDKTNTIKSQLEKSTSNNKKTDKKANNQKN